MLKVGELYFMTKKQKRNKKWISWVIGLALFVGAAVVAYFVWDVYFRVEDKDEMDQNIEQVDTVTGDSTEIDEVVEKPKVIQYDGEDPNVSEELSGVVTYAGVVGENLMIRVNIDQYLEEGECGLELMRDGASVYSDVANIVGNVTTATCEGFDVPVNEIGAGAIEIVIRLNSGDKSGVIRGEVSI